MDTPTELTVVILEPTHSNSFLICCLSGYWLSVLSPVSSPGSLTDMCILLVSQLSTKGTGLVLLTSSHVFYFQYNIPQSGCEDTTQFIHWGLYGGGGQEFTKVRPSILSTRPIAGTHQWLLNNWVMHADLDFISNCPFKPRQLSHNELFLNEFV